MHAHAKIHILQSKAVYCIPKRGSLTMGIIIQTKRRLAFSLKLTKKVRGVKSILSVEHWILPCDSYIYTLIID